MASCNEVMSVGDLNLWEKYTHKAIQPDGSIICSVHPEDGPLIQARFEAGVKPRMRIENWYNHVKGTINAWENEQEAAAAKRAEASRAGSEREDPAAGISGAREIPTAAAVQAREASVEQILESKVSDLGRSLALVEAQIEATHGALAALGAERDKLKKERQRTVAAIKALKEVAGADAS